MEETETLLIRRCKSGDKEAFAGLVQRYAGAARGAAYLIVRNYDDALDAMQDAFILAWRNMSHFNDGAPFYPWFARILHNVCISMLRKKRPRTNADEGALANPRSKEIDPVLLAERNERKDRLWKAILGLPDIHREAIVLYHMQNLSYKEMAETLGVPIGTIMSRLYNARDALRRALKDEEI